MQLDNLPEVVIFQIFEYLDGLSLAAVGSCGISTLEELSLTPHLWTHLDDLISFASEVSRSAHRRVYRHAVASAFAEEMETAVLDHYTFLNPVRDPDEEKRNGELHWEGCTDCDNLPQLNLESFWGPVEFSRLEFFLRISGRSTKSLIWQGFVPAYFEFHDSVKDSGDDDDSSNDSEPGEETRISLDLGRAGASAAILSRWSELRRYLNRSGMSVGLFDDILLLVVAMVRESDDETSLVAFSSYAHHWRIQGTDVQVLMAPLRHRDGSLHDEYIYDEDADDHDHEMRRLQVHMTKRTEGEDSDDECDAIITAVKIIQ
ncbi:hypothetical protein FisN_17Lh162 [Fistulifera solaris]|uniref:F-box domain-containing protein n=1 Tax=Fistulifera solaris TaxID=1519565 RepID=A0A1Z5K8W9_FISSO|nr:hypothetical protein FisN_17Lh162 [Fistulifera solaris]|eukprot:GAX22667.1 hypothetical protein FisN_17Lh162 [Fistulifera solaris]